MFKNQKKGERGINFVINVLLVICGICALYPIWYVIIASFSSPAAISAGEVILWPKGWNVSAYNKLFDESRIWIGYRNSLVYTGVAVVFDLTVQILAAYALSRSTLPHRKLIMTFLIFTMYFNGGRIPKYLVVNSFGLVDSMWALILPGVCNVYNLIVARSFFEANIPDSLLEAAQIDGCSYTRFFLKVAVPLSPAIMAVIALYSIQSHWNAYLGAQMYIYSPNKKTLQQVIQAIAAKVSAALSNEEATLDELVRVIQEQQLFKYAVVIAGAIPLIIIYPFVQKFFVKGVMVGAVKG